MELKRFPVSVKSAETTEDGAKGIVEMFVSVMGNIDHGGDKVMPGAFDEALESIKASGRPLPVIWSHMWNDPKAYVGEHVELEEREVDGKRGLWAKQSYDLTKSPEQSHAAQVFDLLKRGLVTQASFAYEVKDYSLVDPEDGETARRYDGKVRELRKLDLFEAGPCLMGMNPETELLEAASRDRLMEARSIIDAALEGKNEPPAESPEETGDAESIVEAERFARILGLAE